MKLAVVQHGNFAQAKRNIDAGAAETYRGQRMTVEAFLRFARGTPHLVISLDAPDGRQTAGDGEYVGAGPLPRGRLIPTRWRMRLRARRLIGILNQYQPTHLLLRCKDVVGCEILSWSIKNHLHSAVLIASSFVPDHGPDIRFCKLANDSSVAFVANHNRVATDSLIQCGLRPEKAIPWDYASNIFDANYPIKRIRPEASITILFAGAVTRSKGALDLLEACRMLRTQGLPVHLVVLGRGPALAEIAADEGISQGWLAAPGLVSNDIVFSKMLESQVIVVPSRHEFPEALPLVIQEGLATRTPLILSDHPIFKKYFVDGNGVRFFKAADSTSLASVLSRLMAQPDAYQELSRRTQAALGSLRVETTFDQILERLGTLWSPQGKNTQ